MVSFKKIPHIISKVRFDLTMGDEEEFHPLANRLSNLFKDVLTNIIEEILNKNDNPEKVYQFNILEIDLGDFNLSHSLEREIEESLRIRLSSRIHFDVQLAEPVRSVPAEETSPIIEKDSPVPGRIEIREELLKSGKKPIVPEPKQTGQKHFLAAGDMDVVKEILASKEDNIKARDLDLTPSDEPEGPLIKTTGIVPKAEEPTPSEEERTVVFSKPEKGEKQHTPPSEQAPDPEQQKEQKPTKGTALPPDKKTEQRTTAPELKKEPEVETHWDSAYPTRPEYGVAKGTYQHILDGLLFFLRKGRLPWWLSLDDQSVEDVFVWALSNFPQIMHLRLKEMIPKEQGVIQRIGLQFSERALAQLQHVIPIEVVLPSEEKDAEHQWVRFKRFLEGRQDRHIYDEPEEVITQYVEGPSSETPELDRIGDRVDTIIEPAYQGPTVAKVDQRALEVMVDWLLTGRKPWWVDDGYFDQVLDLFDQQITFKIDVIRFIRSNNPGQYLGERLQSKLGRLSLERMLESLFPEVFGFIRTIIEMLLRQPDWLGGQVMEIDPFLLKMVLGARTPTPAFFLGMTIKELGQASDLSEDEVRRKMASYAEAKAKDEPRYSPVVNVILFGLSKSLEGINLSGLDDLVMEERDETPFGGSDFRYMLKQGRIPDRFRDTSQDDFEAAFLRFIKKRPTEVRSIFKQIRTAGMIQIRFLSLFSDNITQSFLDSLLPETASTVWNYLQLLSELSKDFTDDRVLRTMVISYAVDSDADSFTMMDWVSYAVKFIARYQGKSLLEISKRLEEAILHSRKEFSGDQLGRLEGFNQTLQAYHKLYEKSERFKARGPKRDQEEKPKKVSYPDGTEKEPIFVKNAGLVLVWPFLGHLFGRLQMLDENRKFKNEMVASRAVHLLQYLCADRVGAAEQELVLNKILCGLSIDTPIEFGIELTEEEKSLCESLLNAVIGQWSALKNTSLAGLRGGFLVRDGRLIKSGDNWNLRVEKKAYDLLMGKLPWGFSMIKASWMTFFLYVEWEY